MHPIRMSKLVSMKSMQWLAIRSLTLVILFVMVTIGKSSDAFANADIAKRISDGAAITGSRVLIIGFEGLAGFNYSKANQLEAYQCKLSHGLDTGKPFGLGGGHVTSALLVPVVEKHKNKVKTAMFAHDSCRTNNCSLPEAIGSQWMADAGKENTDGRRLIIMGHSFGGDAAAVLARKLAASGVEVDSVFIIDGRKRPTGMGSVGPKKGSARWVTFYQWTDAPLMGFKVNGAENVWLPALPLVGHILLPHNKKILNSVLDQIGNPPGEEITTAAQNTVEVCKNSTLAGMGAYRGTSGIVEGVPVAAVVGGGGYLAYQALKKKKSSGGGGDSGDFLVAESLNGGGKKTNDSNKPKSSSENVLQPNTDQVSSSTSEVLTKESTVVTVDGSDYDLAPSSAASMLEKKEKDVVDGSSLRAPASRTEPTRFSKESLLMATGKNTANNIGGATSLVESLKKDSGVPALVSGGRGSSGGDSSTEEEESSEEELAASEDDSSMAEMGSLFDSAGVSTNGFHFGGNSYGSKSEVDSVFSARMSLFERVNRKLRQKMLSPQSVR